MHLCVSLWFLEDLLVFLSQVVEQNLTHVSLYVSLSSIVNLPPPFILSSRVLPLC